MDSQLYLDTVWDNDKHGFLDNVDTYGNHRPLLLLALSLTQGIVGELGSGLSSTPYLKKYCEAKNRPFFSFDNDRKWAATTGAKYVEKWSDPDVYKRYGVVLVDHAPGEHRHEAIAILKNGCDIIVAHDAEEGGAGGYMYEKIYPLFQYKLWLNRDGGGAGSVALSNKVDLTRFSGLKLAEFKFD